MPRTRALGSSCQGPSHLQIGEPIRRCDDDVASFVGSEIRTAVRPRKVVASAAAAMLNPSVAAAALQRAELQKFSVTKRTSHPRVLLTHRPGSWTRRRRRAWRSRRSPAAGSRAACRLHHEMTAATSTHTVSTMKEVACTCHRMACRACLPPRSTPRCHTVAQRPPTRCPAIVTLHA